MRSLISSRQVSYVPQAHPFSFGYTVEEIVSMGRAKFIPLMASPSKRDMAIVREAMETVGVYSLKDRKCSQLSGGQLQLAFIARALAAEHQAIILDEPESHLDFKNQFTLLNLLETLVRQKNLTCILNTHFPEHALRISQKSIMLGKDGYVFGPTRQVITEENIARFFEVRARVFQMEKPYEDRTVFVVLNAL